MIHINYLDEITNSFINSIINESNFNLETFEKWVDDNYIKTKNNPNAYVRKIFQKELEKGTFTNNTPAIEYVPNCTLLFNAMRENGIEVIPNDTLYIQLLENYLLDKKILTPDELIENNHGGIKYLLDKIKEPTSTDFINAFKRSKMLKGKQIDYEWIASIYDKQLKEWNDLLSFIENQERNNNELQTNLRTEESV